jgi:hypothetical protein
MSFKIFPISLSEKAMLYEVFLTATLRHRSTVGLSILYVLHAGFMLCLVINFTRYTVCEV